MTSPHSDDSVLLAHRDFLRRLARQLVADENSAEDAVQDTLALALERPPRGDVRRWLTAVLRRRAAHTRRAELRRAERERRAARPEAALEEVTSELSLQRRLVEALEALDEPFRTVIVLRYHGDRSAVEIARELGVPLATVRSRLRRGIEKLKRDLERDDPGQSTLAALTHLADRPIGSSLPLTATLGGLVMTTKWTLAACAAVLAVATGLWWTGGSSGLPGAAATGVRAVDAVTLEQPARDAGGRTGGALAEDSASAVASDSGPTADKSLAGFGTGLVVDLAGRPVAGIAVSWEEHRSWEDPTGQGPGWTRPSISDAEGRFPLTGIEEAHHQVETSDLTTVAVGVEHTHAGAAPVLVVIATKASIRGTVLEEDGTPVVGARVLYWPPADWSAELGVILDRSEWDPWETVTAADGRFLFEKLPRMEGATFQAQHRETRRHAVALMPANDALVVELVLTPVPVIERPLRGVVLGPDGKRVPGAQLAFVDTGWAAVSGEDGRFEFDLAKLPGGALLRVAAPGLLPTELPDPAGTEASEPGWPEELTVHLPGKTLVIEGRVVEQDGTPRADMYIGVGGMQHFGLTHSGAFRHLEHILSEGHREGRQTDSEGRFRIEGLLDRPYTLVVTDEEDLRQVRLENVVPGGGEVRLVLPPSAPSVLTGRCLAPDGTPLGHVSLIAMRRGATNLSVFGELTGTTWAGSETRADAQGFFRLVDVPADLDLLEFRGDAVIPGEIEISADADREVFVVHASRRCHLQVEVGARWTTCDRAQFLDASGGRLNTHTFEDDFHGIQLHEWVKQGRTGIFVVGETAVTVVLLDGERELHRESLSLVPGEVARIRID